MICQPAASSTEASERMPQPAMPIRWRAPRAVAARRHAVEKIDSGLHVGHGVTNHFAQGGRMRKGRIIRAIVAACQCKDR